MQPTMLALSGVLLATCLTLVQSADTHQLGTGSGDVGAPGGSGGVVRPSRSKLLAEEEWETVKASRLKRDTDIEGKNESQSIDHPPADVQHDLHDDAHGIMMGIPDGRCDDGHVNLTRDWDNSPINYTCVTQKYFKPDPLFPASVRVFEELPKDYVPHHKCVQEEITYSRVVPTYGDHRPLWPVYGEYKYLPIQRWVHSLEHGTIVMLFHPCADPEQVDALRKLVKGCVWRHIVTPYNQLEENYPMVLVTWGAKLYISKLDAGIVRTFIREQFGHGWEGYDSRNGQFEYLLEIPAAVPEGSDMRDTVICPNQ